MQLDGRLNVCNHFWMEELMWLPKMWDEGERWKIESVSEWIWRREGETVRLTGECVLEEEWMTDICISFWGVKSLDISIYFQTEWGVYHDYLSSLLDGFHMLYTEDTVFICTWMDFWYLFLIESRCECECVNVWVWVYLCVSFWTSANLSFSQCLWMYVECGTIVLFTQSLSEHVSLL